MARNPQRLPYPDTWQIASELIGDGSAAIPSLRFTSDTDTGIYRIGANQLGIATGGTKRVTVSSAGIVVEQAINGITMTSGTNTFTLTRGTTDFVCSGDLTVESTSLINQDLTTDASPTFTAVNGLTIATGTNTITLTRGTTVLECDADLTVEGTSLLNQDLTTDAAPTFAGLTSSSLITYSVGVAITAASYQAGRNADSTNLYQINVPTGASHELSVNDVARFSVSATINTSANVYYAPAGSVTAPAYSFTGATGAGMYEDGRLRFAHLGANLMTLASDGLALSGVDGLSVTNRNSNAPTTLLTLTPYAVTASNTGAERTDIVIVEKTQTWATGALANQRYNRFPGHTIAFAAASLITNLTNFWFDTPNVSTNATVTTINAIQVGGDFTLNQVAGTVYGAIGVPDHTVTIGTLATQITSVGLSALRLGQITLTSGTGTTVDLSSTLYVKGQPLAAGSITLTNAYAACFDAGNVRVDDNILLGTIVAGATAAGGVLAMGNGATAPSASANMCHLYAADAATDNATLGIWAEHAVAAEVILASTHVFKVMLNGTMYKLLLSNT